VQRHLQRLREESTRPTAARAAEFPPELFVGQEDALAFWELIGFRVHGCDELLLGLVCFQRQPSTTRSHARRSLVHYFNVPPKELGVSAVARPSHLIEVRLPRPDQEIAEFLRLDRQGTHGRTVYIDRAHLVLAFDFRVDNPSESIPNLRRVRPLERHLLRTEHGQLITGTTHGLHQQIHGDGLFIAVTQPVQLAPGRSYFLPTLILNRRIVTLDAPVPPGESVREWAASAAMTDPAHASTRHILTPSRSA